MRTTLHPSQAAPLTILTQPRLSGPPIPVDKKPLSSTQSAPLRQTTANQPCKEKRNKAKPVPLPPVLPRPPISPRSPSPSPPLAFLEVRSGAWRPPLFLWLFRPAGRPALFIRFLPGIRGTQPLVQIQGEGHHRPLENWRVGPKYGKVPAAHQTLVSGTGAHITCSHTPSPLRCLNPFLFPGPSPTSHP